MQCSSAVFYPAPLLPMRDKTTSFYPTWAQLMRREKMIKDLFLPFCGFNAALTEPGWLWRRILPGKKRYKTSSSSRIKTAGRREFGFGPFERGRSPLSNASIRIKIGCFVWIWRRFEVFFWFFFCL